MVFALCLGIIVCLPSVFVGITKPRKAAVGKWEYIKMDPYPIFPSRHEVCIKPMRIKRRAGHRTSVFPHEFPHGRDKSEYKIAGAAPPYTYAGNEPPPIRSVAVMVSEKIANLSSGNAI